LSARDKLHKIKLNYLYKNTLIIKLKMYEFVDFIKTFYLDMPKINIPTINMPNINIPNIKKYIDSSFIYILQNNILTYINNYTYNYNNININTNNNNNNNTNTKNLSYMNTNTNTNMYMNMNNTQNLTINDNFNVCDIGEGNIDIDINILSSNWYIDFINKTNSYSHCNYNYNNLLLFVIRVCLDILFILAILTVILERSNKIKQQQQQKCINKCINKYNNTLWYKSLQEVHNNDIANANSNVTNANANYNKDSEYYVLLRVVMYEPIIMFKTNNELHSNNVDSCHKLPQTIPKTIPKNNTFSTRDMYMIVRLVKNNTSDTESETESKNESLDEQQHKNISNTILNTMNYINNSNNTEYKTCDFIVIAIGNNNNNNFMEFYNSFKFNNYDINNFKNIIYYVNNNKNNFILMLPINKIYEIFMDVFTNIRFESKKYKINNENYELWDNIPLNKLIN